MGHEIGRGGEVALDAAHHVAEGFPVRVAGARLGVGDDEPRQGIRRTDARRRERDLVDARRLPWLCYRHAETFGERAADAAHLLAREAGVVPAPAPEAAAARLVSHAARAPATRTRARSMPRRRGRDAPWAS